MAGKVVQWASIASVRQCPRASDPDDPCRASQPQTRQVLPRPSNPCSGWPSAPSRPLERHLEASLSRISSSPGQSEADNGVGRLTDLYTLHFDRHGELTDKAVVDARDKG